MSWNKAQIEALRTDLTLNGRQETAAPKIPGVDTLPSGWSLAGIKITANQQADIVNWDFTGFHFQINSGADGSTFTDCIFGERDGASGIFQYLDMYGSVDFSWCDFIGPNDGRGVSRMDKLRNTSVENNYFACRFWHYASDAIKPHKGSIIQCYFDPPVDVPTQPTVWNNSTTYNIDDCVIENMSKQALVWRCRINGVTNVEPPWGTTSSTTEWSYNNPHSDIITIPEVFGSFEVRNTYFNGDYNEAYHTPLGGSIINNSLRLGGGGEIRQFDQLTVESCIFRYDPLSNSYCLHEAYTGGNFTLPIMNNCWLDPNSGDKYNYAGSGTGGVETGRWQWGDVRDYDTDTPIPKPSGSVDYDDPNPTTGLPATVTFTVTVT